MNSFEAVSARIRGIADRWSAPVDDGQASGNSRRGAFPAAGEPVPATTVPTSSGAIVPHHSPGQSEWFFTLNTSKHVASLLEGSSLHLGTPTIALAAGAHATLVDSSPWVTSRFGFFQGSHHEEEVERFHTSHRFDSASLDPPWYGRNMVRWLAIASSLVRPGGAIVLPLLGESTRPSAVRDRREILKLAERIGRHSLKRDAVEYDIPTFEARALEQAGVSPLTAWRKADLLILRNDNPQKTPNLAPELSEWNDIRIGDHLVSIRLHLAEGVGIRDDPPPGRSYDPLGTVSQVSRRDPLLQSAHVWTCENRIIAVKDPNAFLDLIEDLAGHPTSDDPTLIDLRRDLFGGDA